MTEVGTQTLLRVDGVTKNFGGLTAARNVSFGVRSGQICGIIGPNGAGKTTVFNLITGVFPVSSGSIHLNGTDITDKRPHDITKLGIARTFQNIRLFHSMTVLENVLVAQNLRAHSGPLSLIPFLDLGESRFRMEAEQLLHLTGLSEKRHTKAINLPYGDQRRLEIARALATEPRLLLLDEPAAGMNPAESEELVQELFRIRDLGVTILLIEHDMRVVMGLCDYVFVLNFGEKIAAGTPAEIQRNDLVIEAYLGREE